MNIIVRIQISQILKFSSIHFHSTDCKSMRNMNMNVNMEKMEIEVKDLLVIFHIEITKIYKILLKLYL